jgi:hypothetical protein
MVKLFNCALKLRERKHAWYLQNGFVEGVSLFTTQGDEKGGLDSEEVRGVAQQIKELV